MSLDKSWTGFQPADYPKALQQQQELSNQYYKNEPVPYLCPLSHFKMYGVGFYLFFSFLKNVTILFLVLTLLSVAPIAFNVVRGNTFINSQNSLDVIIAKTSLGSYSYALMTGADAYQTSIQNKVFNASFDIVACVFFLGFCLFWERKSRTIAKHIEKEIKLQSSMTIEVVDFPAKTKEVEMKEFMEKFGTVVEAVAAKDYCKEIELAKEIIKKETEKKILQSQLAMQPVLQHQKINQEIQAITQKLKLLNKWLEEFESQSHEVTRFYIQFDSSQTRDQVLHKFKHYQGFFGLCRTRPECMLLNSAKVSVSPCNTEPIGVLWQNAHVSWKERIPRLIFQTVIILGIMVGGFIFVSFLNILIPPLNTNTNTSGLTFSDISASTNSAAVQAWCIKNFSISLSSSPYYSTCMLYWNRYMASTLVSISISVVILLLCELIRRVVYALAELQRYRTLADKSLNIFTNLFVTEFLTTTLIVFLMQANIFSLSVMTFLERIITNAELLNNIKSISEYGDLTSGWYKAIGYQIWFNLLVMCFLPHVFMPVVSYLRECLARWLAQKHKLHRLVLLELELPEFPLEESYSKIMVVMATGFIFGGGIPLMMVMVFFCLLFRYWYFRYHFIRFCRVPPVYNQILNDRVVSIMKGILICRCLISIYMYGADDIFAMEHSTFMQWSLALNYAVVRSVFIILSRALLTWYFSMFLVLFVLVLVLRELLVEGARQLSRRVRKCIKGDQGEQGEAEGLEQTGEDLAVGREKEMGMSSWASNENEEVRSQRARINSYRLERNPNYADVLLIMRMRKEWGQDSPVIPIIPMSEKIPATGPAQ